MGTSESDDEQREPGMIKDEVVLSDGRYLIYYTFEAAEHASD